jgi:hypothetical protein
MGDRWGSEGPPTESYSRVTDPDRYTVLHATGREVLDELVRRYDVVRETSSAADPHGKAAAPVITLIPSDSASSPLAIVFDAFPGLTVRIGRDDEAHLPTCGCDACDETVEECVEKLRQYLEAVVAGSFGERLVHEDGWWHEHWYQASDAAWSGRQPVPRSQLNALRAGLKDGELHWAPWPERASAGRQDPLAPTRQPKS